MKKEYNSIRALIQDFSIPPYIAMYHNIHSRNIEDCLEKHQNELLIIMHEILCEHPNLIEDTSIPLLTYIRQYLAKYWQILPIVVYLIEKLIKKCAIKKDPQIYT